MDGGGGSGNGRHTRGPRAVRNRVRVRELEAKMKNEKMCNEYNARTYDENFVR